MPARLPGRSLWLLPFFLFSLNAFPQKIIDGVQLETSKTKSVRHLKATKSVTLFLSLEESLKLVLNFDEKCNNKFKDKRKWTDKSTDCKHHNNNLIETVHYRELNRKAATADDQFLLLRHGYNRGTFLYFEEITLQKFKTQVHVRQRLLTDDEVAQVISTKLKTNFSFQQVNGLFHLQSLGEKKTQLTYTYESSTDHWLLNKEMMVGEIFESTAKGINDLFLSFASGMNAP